MQRDTPFLRTVACITGGLIVTWIGSCLGAAGFKTIYWLSVSSWPETAIHALVPDPLIRDILAMPEGDMLRAILLALLHVDILTYLLFLPLLLILPGLVILRVNRQPFPMFTRSVHPFAAAPPPNRAPNPPESEEKPSAPARGGILGKRPGMPVPGDSKWTHRRG